MTGGNGSRSGGENGTSGGPETGARQTPAAVSGAEFAGIGLQFAAVILAFTFAGYGLDKRLGTSPWLLVLGVFGGAGAGFYSMFLKVSAAQRRDADARAKNRAGRTP